MSVHVLSRFLKESQSEMASRLVGIAMAHASWNDGICWADQKRLMHEARMSESSVRRAIRDLEQLGEIETRHAQRGRSRINVYRLWCAEEPDYERLPFTINAPFTTTGQSDRRSDTPGPPVRSDHDHRSNRASTPSLERKENVRTKEELAAVPAAPEYDPLKGVKIDGRNLPWDMLAEVTQSNETVDAGVLARSLKQIRSFVVGASSPQTFYDPLSGERHIAVQIAARARLYRQRWPNVELTPGALAKHWARVTTEPPGGSPEGALDAAQRGIDSARRTA